MVSCIISSVTPYFKISGGTMLNQKKSAFLNRSRLRIVSGFTFALALFLSPQVFASTDTSDVYISIESLDNVGILVAQHMGPPEGKGPGHGGLGQHCPDMDFEKGCTGRKGMGHRGGGMGMHHGGGQNGDALCPQPRATVKAPDKFYSLVNPLENTPANIEKGRLLFSADVQPTCAMCHGDKGDGTGGFGADMTPKPRNFTCADMMKDIPDGQLFWVIQKGSPDTGMPPFQGLQDEQIWQLVIYIRSLAK
jgi:mono/diheme cytochrome c family protein